MQIPCLIRKRKPRSALWPFLPVVLLLVGAVLCKSASANPEARLIAVTGESEVRVAPDEVNITLGIETGDLDITAVARKNAEQVRKVVAMAKQFAIDAKDIGTDRIALDKHYEYVNGKNQFREYQARRTVSLRLKDLNRFEDLLIAVLQGGATSIQGVQFCTSQLRKHRDQARASALKAAAEKAADMAKQLGQRVGKPHAISELSDGWSAWSGARGASYANVQNVVQSAGSSMADSSAVGLITISAKVSVSFELE